MHQALVILLTTLLCVNAQELIFGQSAALTGPSSSLGLEMRLGLRAAFRESNTQGLLPYNLTLNSLDDGYEPGPAFENTKQFIQEGVFALIGEVGTPTSQVAIPLAIEAQVPFIGPFTGAKFLRIPYQRYIVNLRASYIDETAAMVNYFVVNLLYTRISIFLQDDSFGMAGHEGLELALQAQRLAIYGEGRYTRNTMDVEQGLQDIKKAVEDLSLGPPEAIVMIGAYSPLAKFVKLAKLEWPNVRFCTVSFVGSIPFSEALGDEESRKNVFVTQVVPRPTDTSIPIVQRYQAALLEEDPNEQVGFGSLEGYLVGRMTISVLQRFNAIPTREEFLDSLYDNGIAHLGEDFRIGPFGGHCSQTGSGCMCNQGMRSVFFSEIESDGSFKFNYDMTFSFTTCGFQPQLPGELVFGQSAVLSGPSAELGIQMRTGILAAFQEVNRLGGVRGRRLRLISLDDKYEPEPARNNTIRLIEEYNVFALIGEVGTPTSVVAVPVALKHKVPFIGAFTGAKFLRIPFEPLILNMRASYIDETASMVNFFVGQKHFFKVSIFYQADSFGLAGLEGLEIAMSARGLPIYSYGTFVRNTMDVEQGLEDVATSMTVDLGDPEAIVMIGTYSPLAKFVKLAKKRWPNALFSTVSFVGSNAFSAELGDAESRRNVFVTQVVPLPDDTSRPLIRQYQKALRDYDSDAGFGFVSLEGYMAARFAIAALERITRHFTRENFVDVIYSTGVFPLDSLIRLGPYSPNCTGPGCQCNQGMREVFMTNMDESGHFHLVNGADFLFETCGYQESFQPEICSNKHWSYKVNDCDSSTQLRYISYSWNDPYPWDSRQSLVCRGGSPIPGDIEIPCERVLASSGVAIGMNILIGISIVASIVFGVVMIWKRKSKLMVNSQYRFLLVMVVGCICALLAQILSVGDASSTTCLLSPSLLSCGLSLMLISIFVRTNRIKRIFDNPNMKKVKVTDRDIWSMILLLLTVEILLIVLWVAVDNPHASFVTEQEYFGPVERLKCVSDQQSTLPVLIFFKFSLLLTSCFFAYRVRKAPSDFHEARFFLMATYNILMSCIVVIPLTILVELEASVLFIFQSIGLLVGVMGAQLLIIGPKILLLAQGKGETYSDNSKGTATNTAVGNSRRKKSKKISNTSNMSGYSNSNNGRIAPESEHSEKSDAPLMSG